MPVAELDRQTDRLLSLDLPGLTPRRLRAAVAPLRAAVPDVPFVLVVTGLPVHDLVPLTALRGKAGFTSMEADDVARFVPLPSLELPTSRAYLLVDPSTGPEHLDVPPARALPALLADGRSPLTLDEGLAVVLQHPEWLRERSCFSMLGARCGDRRVPAWWVSGGRPRLGWCWDGAPHTWLGSASCASRVGAPVLQVQGA